MYTALVGKGAFRQTAQDASPRRLPLSPPLPLPSLRQAVVAVEWGSDRKKETIDKKTRSFAKLCGSEEEGVEGGRFVQGECEGWHCTVSLAQVCRRDRASDQSVGELTLSLLPLRRTIAWKCSSFMLLRGRGIARPVAGGEVPLVKR